MECRIGTGQFLLAIDSTAFYRLTTHDGDRRLDLSLTADNGETPRYQFFRSNPAALNDFCPGGGVERNPADG
jgi:hypothetical protein